MFRFLSRRIALAKGRAPEYLVPVVAGCTILIASVLPWLRTPFGQSFSAWQLPLDLGFHSTFLNYGFFCLGCACYCFFTAAANYRAMREQQALYSFRTSALLCLMPLLCFLLQYLYLDFGKISLLAQQKTQILLISRHFGYSIAPDLFPLSSSSIQIMNVQGRFQLLADQMRIGTLVPLLSVWVLLDHKWPVRRSSLKKQRAHPYMITVVTLFGIVLLLMSIRVGGWIICMKLAANESAQSNQTNALQWLNRALIFNPSLNQVAFYHIDRGQVLYLINPNQPNEDSSAYLATYLGNRRDYRDAYQQLVPIWQKNRTNSWIVEKMDSLLEGKIESTGSGQIAYLPQDATQVVKKDSLASPWLDLLTQTDPGNLYGQYMLGRIYYDLREYDKCKMQMLLILSLSSNTDFQSSVYTYLALSEAGLGNYTSERTFLLEAVQLDPAYHNNVAREELSGLH